MEAKNNLNFETFLQYCVALANERGGHLILGVSNRMPRRVVGTTCVADAEGMKKKLLDSLHFRVEIHELRHPDGRVVVLEIPSRPIGTPLDHRGTYWMRSGEALVGMTADQLKRIFDESVPDYSAEFCAGAAFSDLDPVAIDRFRERWLQKSENPNPFLTTDNTDSTDNPQ